MRTTWLAATLFLAAATAHANTVAIAPFVATGKDDAWLAEALAHSVSGRLYELPSINVMTVRQVSAAARSLGIEESKLADGKQLAHVGKQVGADVMVGGTLKRKGEALSLDVVMQGSGKPIKMTVKGVATDLLAFDRSVAEKLAPHLGVTDAATFASALVSDNQSAYIAMFTGLYGLRAQSLSPKAADPLTPSTLSNEELLRVETLMKEAVVADPRLAAAHAGVAIVAALRGEQATAKQALAQAQGGKGPFPTLAAVFVAMRGGDVDSAQKALTEAIAAHPGFAHARGTLGQLYNHVGRFREARSTFAAYVERVPKQPWAKAQLGYTLARLRKYDEAIAITQEAVTLVPDSAELLLELVSRYVDAKRYAEAKAPLERAIKLAPKDGRLYVRLGYLELKAGDHTKSIKASETALKYVSATQDKKERSYAHMNLARAWAHMGQYDVALDQLTQVKKLGLLDCSEIENDEALAKFRADTRYQQLKF